MSGVYQKLGVRFQYPDNWTVDEDEAHAKRNVVTVHGPGGDYFWSLMIYPPEADPGELAAQVLQTMRDEYEQLDAEPLSETIAGRETVGYTMNFYCLDLTNTALVRGLSTATGTYLIHCQAEDRDFEKIKLVFQAMTTSLLMQMADAAG